MTRVVVSLTAIPPRFPYLDEVLQVLLRQTLKPEAILLNIPQRYRRESFNPVEPPVVPEGVTLNRVERDFGPATKVLPAVQKYRDQDMLIFFCDDDKIYDPQVLERFVAAAETRPDCCIVEEGSDIFEASEIRFSGTRMPRYDRRRKDWLYRVKRAASLGTWKSRKAASSGYADILEGWGGVMVRPSFFGDEVFDIPDPLWLVDDIWLSGHLTTRNVPIWLDFGGPRARASREDVKQFALLRQVVGGLDRTALNTACVRYYQETYGIWR
ncbi:glycosyltransferase family A protein [Pseudotabrizicola sediminis]|nr:glycosyltransferase family A protein [Pseudotabrizicola sediminis]